MSMSKRSRKKSQANDEISLCATETNTPIYKPLSKRVSNTSGQSRRSNRQLQHVYDLDVTEGLPMPFKKTRDGFKIKKIVGKRKAKNTKKTKNILEPHIVKEKCTKKTNTKKRDILINESSKQKLNGSVQKVLKVRLVRMTKSPSRYEKIPIQKEAEAAIYFKPNIDKNGEDSLSDICLSDLSHDITLPDYSSTPSNVKLDAKQNQLRKALLQDFESAHTVNKSDASRRNVTNSPWRMVTTESNRLPANFSIKDSFLPTYDRDTSLRFSNLRSASSLSLPRNESSCSIPLFDDSPNTTEQSGKDLQILQSSVRNTEDMEKHDDIHNCFGFDETSDASTNILKIRNENVPRATRISLREIKNVIYNTRKPRKTSDKENMIQDKSTKKTKPAVLIQKEQVDIQEPVQILSSIENISTQSLQSDEGNNILLFDDPDVTFSRDKSFHCYEPKPKKKRKMHPVYESTSATGTSHGKTDKLKRQLAKNKLSTEEWVAAKTWERNFNAMVEEVESFEMVVE